MNAVEIEEAVSVLAAEPFDGEAFPFRFLEAFGNKETTIKRLRSGSSNASDVPGGVLQRNNIHLAVAAAGEVQATLAALRESPKTGSGRAKFILATDGETVEAEDLLSGEPLSCPFPELAQHFALFLPLAGISTVREIKNNPIDVKATGRLNKLYVELLKDNPDWATEERRHALNQFMARLIFCFFAEDTGIFRNDQFTATISQFTEAGHGSGPEQWGNTHEVLAELFRAMDVCPQDRLTANVKSWADVFPYVNGGLFTDATTCPRFSRMARSYLLRAGELDWKEINPDIFGSMIQAVADDGERGELGMHYTSVPNILKVLNPLFLDGLREQLEAAGDSVRKLKNLRRRLGTIRVFDPACGSGNFLVIAYKQMREIEAEVVRRLGGEASLKLDDRRSVIPLSNFYGIEIKGFAAEIARLALLIAEFQADCLYLSQQEARAMVLPLHKTGQITVGNALRLDWLEVCPPVSTRVAAAHDLAGPTRRLMLEENGLDNLASLETYICGNPPYRGNQWQTDEQKSDLEAVFSGRAANWKSLDYVAGWFMKGADYGEATTSASAFVSTNSICQGRQVETLWSHIFATSHEISFAHTSFSWANLASHNAGVTVVIVGISNHADKTRELFAEEDQAGLSVRSVANINGYLVPGPNVAVSSSTTPLDGRAPMQFGNHTYYGVDLLLNRAEAEDVITRWPEAAPLLRNFLGAREVTTGLARKCLWMTDADLPKAAKIPPIQGRLDRVSEARRKVSHDRSAQLLAAKPHMFREQFCALHHTVVVPAISSENRPFLPVALVPADDIVGHKSYALYDAPLWNVAMLVSRLHWVWIGTVCARMRTDFSYSNTLGWNTFPVPKLTEQDKADLTRCAEDILIAREAHFPATIADLYDPEAMPENLRRAHDANDEVLERIYIGRRFRNDTERLEKLFELYTRMTADAPKPKKGRKAAPARAAA